MYHIIRERLKCSKCGSTAYEYFQQGYIKGTRCLKCGHEKTVNTMPRETESVSWEHDPNRVEEF